MKALHGRRLSRSDGLTVDPPDLGVEAALSVLTAPDLIAMQPDDR